MGGTAANPASDVVGDTLTLVNATVVNSSVRLTCIDDGQFDLEAKLFHLLFNYRLITTTKN